MSTATLASRIIAYNRQLEFTGPLPPGISIMNPFKENEYAFAISSAFYKKYYNDNKKRHLILGINPGRFGAGITGIPFTDTKRLQTECGIPYSGKETHEPSSVFIYEMINAFGGAEAFYKQFYIHSIFPLGFTATGKNCKEVNYNYYDSKELLQSVRSFIIAHIRTQIALGMETDVCFCFGTGKNEKFLRELNEEYKFFGKIIALEHPRFIVQYKTKTKHEYIKKYLDAFHTV